MFARRLQPQIHRVETFVPCTARRSVVCSRQTERFLPAGADVLTPTCVGVFFMTDFTRHKKDQITFEAGLAPPSVLTRRNPPFLARHVRERKYFSGCKCGICAPMAHKLCAQQTAILLPKKPKGFSAVLRGTPVRASLFSSPPHPSRFLNGGRCPHRTKSPMDAPHLLYILPYSAVGCRRPRLDRTENFGYNRRYNRCGGIYAVRR